MQAAYCVAAHERVPSHPAKHLKLAPRGAQSESSAHAFEQSFTDDVQPASDTEPASERQERPAAHSESPLHTVPADFNELLLQATTASSGVSTAANRAGVRRRVIMRMPMLPRRPPGVQCHEAPRAADAGRARAQRVR